MTETCYKDIKEVIQLTPQKISRCEPCNYLPKSFADCINHYLTKHDYQLLHVGTQSSFNDTGDIVHDVTALLGK